MEQIVAQLVKTKTFEQGDIICHLNNYVHGFYSFFTATDTDVENYSGKNGTYIKLIKL